MACNHACRSIQYESKADACCVACSQPDCHNGRRLHESESGTFPVFICECMQKHLVATAQSLYVHHAACPACKDICSAFAHHLPGSRAFQRGYASAQELTCFAMPRRSKASASCAAAPN